MNCWNNKNDLKKERGTLRKLIKSETLIQNQDRQNLKGNHKYSYQVEFQKKKSMKISQFTKIYVDTCNDKFDIILEKMKVCQQYQIRESKNTYLWQN